MSLLSRLFSPPDVEKMKGQGDVQGLVKALDCRDAAIRDAAGAALVAMGEPAVAPLVTMALGPDTTHHAVAVEILSRIGRPALAPMLAGLRADYYANPATFTARAQLARQVAGLA